MRHVTLPTELMGASQLRMWRAWQRAERGADVVSPFQPDAAPTQLVPELRPTEREAVLDKITMSAFEGTWLDIVLRDCGITTVALVGVALEIGIEPTARHAADRGYVPVLITDACGAGDTDAAQRSLEALRFAGIPCSPIRRSSARSSNRRGDTAIADRQQHDIGDCP
jgi:nicotinamidase-related amidase